MSFGAQNDTATSNSPKDGGGVVNLQDIIARCVRVQVSSGSSSGAPVLAPSAPKRRAHDAVDTTHLLEDCAGNRISTFQACQSSSRRTLHCAAEEGQRGIERAKLWRLTETGGSSAFEHVLGSEEATEREELELSLDLPGGPTAVHKVRVSLGVDLGLEGSLGSNL